jgi:hypothetical protein
MKTSNFFASILLMAAGTAFAAPGALDEAYIKTLKLDRGRLVGLYLADDADRLSEAQTRYGFDSSITGMSQARAATALREFFAGHPDKLDAALADHQAGFNASPEGATMVGLNAQIQEVEANPCQLESVSHCTEHLEKAVGRSVDPAVTTFTPSSGVPGDVFGAINGSCVRHILPSQFNKNPSCECLANYLVSQRRKRVRRNTMGFNTEDSTYLRDSEEVEAKFAARGKPGMMTLPPLLKTLLEEGGGSFPADYRSRIPADWQVLEYSSRTVGNPVDGGNPRSYRRTLFKVPGADFDRWIQFTSNTASGDADERQNLIDYIAIQKTDAETGEELEDPRIHFNQYWRQFSGSTVNMTRRDHAGQSFDTCITCHPNGMREISPSPGSVGVDQRDTLKAFNQSMKDYGQIDWGPRFDVPSTDARHHSALGPPLGQSSGCIRCHNGLEPTEYEPNNRGALSAETSTGHVRHKLLGDLSMPPRPYLADFWAKVAMVDDNVNWGTEDYRRLQLELVEPNNSDEYRSYSRVLDRLKSQGRITAEEHSDLTQELADYKAEGAVINDLFSRESAREVDSWLTAVSCGPLPQAMDEFENDEGGH